MYIITLVDKYHRLINILSPKRFKHIGVLSVMFLLSSALHGASITWAFAGDIISASAIGQAFSGTLTYDTGVAPSYVCTEYNLWDANSIRLVIKGNIGGNAFSSIPTTPNYYSGIAIIYTSPYSSDIAFKADNLQGWNISVDFFSQYPNQPSATLPQGLSDIAAYPDHYFDLYNSEDGRSYSGHIRSMAIVPNDVSASVPDAGGTVLTQVRQFRMFLSDFLGVRRSPSL